MADAPLAAQRSPCPARAQQRCPNCEARADVSIAVEGALVRCSRCRLRFEVRRSDAAAQIDARAPEVREARRTLQAAGADPAGTAEQEASAFPELTGFCLHQRLGQGGMGEVYRATRLWDARAVAVKVLSDSLAAVPDYVRRFDREAAAMAQLDHPGIVRLLGRGRSGPHCWIAMELVDGISLRTHVQQMKPGAAALARLLAQVARALAYAHERAVVHRDLKPDNVLVLPDGRTKMLDFGLAGLHAEGAEALTQSDVAMGTANYMAPEQRKDARRADHRADLYSFGVMVYELLTEELPIGRFVPASQLVPDLDEGWDALIERCLSRDPASRPRSALDLARALERLPEAPRKPASMVRDAAAHSRLRTWLGI